MIKHMRSFKFIAATCLLIGLAFASESGGPAPSVQLASAAEVPAVDCGKAIEQSELELKTATENIATLEASLAEVTGTLQATEQQLADATKRNTELQDESRVLSQRAQQLEELTSALETEVQSRAEEVAVCKEEKETLSQSSEALSTCSARVEGHALEIEELSKKAAERRADLQSCQKKMREELEGCQGIIAKQKKEWSDQRSQLQAKLTSLENDLQKATDSLKKVADNSYLYSVAQFKNSVVKFVDFSRAVMMFVTAKVDSVVPISEEVPTYFNQARVASHAVYQRHLAGPVERVGDFVQQKIAPRIVPHVAPHVASATSVTGRVLSQVKAKVAGVVDVSGVWTEQHVVAPFLESQPAMKAVVPEKKIDRWIALAYFLGVLYILARVLRCAIQAVLQKRCCRSTRPQAKNVASKPAPARRTASTDQTSARGTASTDQTSSAAESRPAPPTSKKGAKKA